MTKNRGVILIFHILISLAVLASAAPAAPGSVQKDLPEVIDPSAKYLFYMHGFAIEQGWTPCSGFEGYLQFAKRRDSAAQGHLFSAYDKNDQIAGSCKPALDKMSKAKVTERVLEIGGGHEVFYTPKAAWLDILQAWAERRQIFK